MHHHPPSELAKTLSRVYKTLLSLALLSMLIGVTMVTVEFRGFRYGDAGFGFYQYRPYIGLGFNLIGFGIVAGVLGIFGAIEAKTRTSTITKALS